MYKITTRSKKAEKQLYAILEARPIIRGKLENLKEDPRGVLNAHKLRGKLEGKWSCYLGWDIRLVYTIEEDNKEIVVYAAGSHKVY